MSDNEETNHRLTIPIKSSDLKKNGFVVLNGRPCKIVEMSTSKTGKHGHAKVNLVGIDIFTGKKYEDLLPSTQMEEPIVTRQKCVLTNISDDEFVSLLLENGETRDDIKLPAGELGKNFYHN
jgi:translation initiation factor 5A